MLRGIADIRGNVRNEGAVTFFSTGTNIPATRIGGTVFDWIAGTPGAGALVEAFVLPDTINSYIAVTDSSGTFVLQRMPAGRYTLRAFIDRNRNQSLDPGEPWDSAGVTLTDTLNRELLVFVHDTAPPRIRDVSMTDSVTIAVTFDKPIDPGQTLGIANFRVVAPDSSAMTILKVGTPTRDTAARAAPRDTAARPQAIPNRAPAAASPGRPLTRPDTARRPTMSRPIPQTAVNLTVQRPLTPRAVYRVRAVGIRGLLGVTGDSERSFTVPAPPARPTPAAAPPASPASPPPRK
jgi:hypothetical protein